LALPILTLPFLAGLLAQAAGLQALFAVSLAFSVAAALWFLFRVREPRDVRLVDAGGA
jgi:Na+/melibiose symporter-like transporter